MKVLILYDYPPSPGGLSTQGDLLYKGLLEHGTEAFPVNSESPKEKEWYYRWFKPDVVVGIGYWGYTPHIILHPREFGMRTVPWLVADGYIANYQEVLNALPLILVTSRWVKDVYVRDGINERIIEVLPVGCETDLFTPHEGSDERIRAVRETFGVSPEELMILTVGGDGTSKGAQEVMGALSVIDRQVPPWKYICKVWPQRRTEIQNLIDRKLAKQLHIEKKVTYTSCKTSRAFTSFLLGACDIYAAPSRIEGFGMLQVEACACEKPVLSINAMGMLDTIVHRETGLLAKVAHKNVISEVTLGRESGFRNGQRIQFNPPRIVDYRADIPEIAGYLTEMMTDAALREKLGKAARAHVVKNFDYRIIAKRFVNIISEKFGID
jgi:glycosyltransferase involved in cell wall biosynthesis